MITGFKRRRKDGGGGNVWGKGAGNKQKNQTLFLWTEKEARKKLSKKSKPLC